MIRTPVLLSPAIQHYAWGDPTFLPELLGLPAGAPHAEAWYGAHPVAPARAMIADAGSREQPLDALLAARGEAILGAAVHARFGRLPYLLKILAAARPLSIQVHPSGAQAEAGFAREEAAGIPIDAPQRCYRDASHKPELLVALTPFDALCGFRSPDEIAAALADAAEVSALLPAYRPGPDGLRAVLEAYFALPEARVQPALAAWLARLEASQWPETQPAYWVLRAHRALDGAPDRGLLLIPLLAMVRLAPGQGLFLPAGVPHAYLQGAGIELMASSDNVLRAGLTAKHVDPAELLRVVRFDAGRPPVVEAAIDEAGREARWCVPADELELRRLRGDAPIERVARGPETLLAMPEGADTVTVLCEGQALPLERGQACLVPDGARYRVAGGAVYCARVPGGEPVPSFRGRAPTPLAFGTSGLRGLVTDITDLEAYVNTRGFLDYLVAAGEAVPGTPVALAGDLRPSTDSPERSIARAVAAAITDSGMAVINGGRIPTPALTAFAVARSWPSVMVTGSHIPFDRNGIKFNRPDGEVLKSHEAEILAAVARVRACEYTRARDTSRFDDDGWLRPAHARPLPEATDEARRAYVRRYLDAFPAGALAGLRIALYEHSAVGRELLGEVLAGLGAEVHPIGRSETFVAIDTEAITPAQLGTLQALADAVAERVGPVDALVSTDGDSDRPLVLVAGDDGRLRFFGGDVLGAVVADYLGADAIAVPVSASDLIERHFAPRGVPVVRTRIGSPWVIAAMAALPGERRVGWEANGGFLLGSPVVLPDGTLAPLPTRDAFLPIICALHAARRQGVAPAAVFEALPQRSGRSGLLDDVDPAASRALLRRFGAGAGVRGARFEGGVSWTDDHGVEHPADARATALLAVRDALAAHFTAARGFGAIAWIDYLDGIRLGFDTGDIAHVRPSGNAPQLRIYAVADHEARAEEIVRLALAEPDGILRGLLADATAARFVAAIRDNIAVTAALFAGGEPAGVLGTVSGSAAAQAFWQDQLERVRADFRARQVLSLHEDLPVNQAFGLLLAWQRLRPHLRAGEGALIAFVFGEGSRATPITEAEAGQKPAIASFVATGAATDHGAGRRYLSIVELALRYFAPVERYLRRSGFDGMVVKWGDEVQIPTLDLAGADDRFAGADVVRFVSLREITADDAANKDWVGVDADGRVTAFIPRRPLAAMEALADRGLLQRRGARLYGGVNLGSIALSRALLDALLDEFGAEVNDPSGHRKDRPDLDPQLFTALTIAVIADRDVRLRAWQSACAESPAIARLDAMLPGVLARLRGALDRFEAQHGRPVNMVAMDFGDQYWGDIGQHRQMHDFYLALRARGPAGDIARALAGLTGEPDADGNLIAGDTRLGPGVRVRDSVLIDAHIDAGDIESSVLLGTRVGTVRARDAFDVQSQAPALALAARAGSYKVRADEPVVAGPGERVTTVPLPDGAILMRVHEDTDLRDRAATYDQPILGNPLSFREAHERVTRG